MPEEPPAEAELVDPAVVLLAAEPEVVPDTAAGLGLGQGTPVDLEAGLEVVDMAAEAGMESAPANVPVSGVVQLVAGAAVLQAAAM